MRKLILCVFALLVTGAAFAQVGSGNSVVYYKPAKPNVVVDDTLGLWQIGIDEAGHGHVNQTNFDMIAQMLPGYLHWHNIDVPLFCNKPLVETGRCDELASRLITNDPARSRLILRVLWSPSAED